MSSAQKPTRIFPRTKDEQIRRIGLHQRWWRDLYHGALTIGWPWFLLYATLAYLTVNALFALLYLLRPGSIQNAQPGSFLDAFFFSVQCMSTIGFGNLLPTTIYANTLVTAEAIVYLAVTALATGSVFARISRPTARVMFASCAVIGPYNGVPTLSFRLGNRRTSQILEATVGVSLLKYERTAEGDLFRRFYDLKLARSHTPVFSLTFTVMHPIDEESPLAGLTAETMEDAEAEILITVTGLEEVTTQNVHARHSYSWPELQWGARFTDIFVFDKLGRRVIDYSRFHDTEPSVISELAGGG